MAAFAAAVKIDAFAYTPAQDFGNAFSTFIAQNYGAGRQARIRAGVKGAVLASFVFCSAVSAAVWVLAKPLMMLFVSEGETAILAEGVRYLHIEGAFYCGIGCLSLLYGLYRAVGRPGMSVVLTVISLGTRVALAYLLSAIPAIGVVGIWWSIPIGWFLAHRLGPGGRGGPCILLPAARRPSGGARPPCCAGPLRPPCMAKRQKAACFGAAFLLQCGSRHRKP